MKSLIKLIDGEEEQEMDSIGLLDAANELSQIMVETNQLKLEIENLTLIKESSDVDYPSEDIEVFSEVLAQNITPSLTVTSKEGTLTNINLRLESLMHDIAAAIKKFIEKLIAFIKKILPFLKNIDEKISSKLKKFEKASSLKWKKEGVFLNRYEHTVYGKLYKTNTVLNESFMYMVNFIFDNFNALQRGNKAEDIDKKIKDHEGVVTHTNVLMVNQDKLVSFNVDMTSPREVLDGISNTHDLYLSIKTLKKSLLKAKAIDTSYWNSDNKFASKFNSALRRVNNTISITTTVLKNTYMLLTNIEEG